MRILILNGSPKGKYSVTLQTCRYLEILHPEHVFSVLHVGQRIKSLERDFSPALDALKKADLILFSYPVYTFLAPSQLHSFIRLMKQAPLDFSQKYATQLSTSKHFYDFTAQKYIEENCLDLKLRYIPGLSADMDDLTTEKGRKDARAFFDYVCWHAAQGLYTPVPPAPQPSAHIPAHELPEGKPENHGDVVIVTDCQPDNLQLAAMIRRFQHRVVSRVVNIREYPMKGGCLGCFRCAATGKCVYTDGFDQFLRTQIQNADAIVYAFSIQDHSMGDRFKLYDDRQFCNGHRTVTVGIPVAYLISGNYRAETNLQAVIEARAQVGQTYLAGVADDQEQTDQAIDRVARELTYAMDHAYQPPQNFYGVGGMKIFRDLIWVMRGIMKADHKFYKANKLYDFPQKSRGRMIGLSLVGLLTGSEHLQKKMGSAMNEGMLLPYQKVLKQARNSMESTSSGGRK